ncbi:FMN reductase (NADPH)/FMN reductase [NAD(P)H] [Halanaerobium saccharolyticum]|uniref:FMN reductase (NADPH)/FMN reductase [NAD(P)H] n=1 Tax=Halanaerobium saccharolyticum TaxID=43595 RepID=A0A4R7YVR5_9FIRM|nr:nitroreductase family protein [Halanaerobium saccharolyticum]RAK06676.1 FMN reductase (NADPH)/FMN reductase [NAD(P)H] [Halanaerobium saccharolyticum]TDW01313.1 FMN reductase (NADPH)/FMN reductase [NAD(P)H] [Halanaerobium saccharolyticum]TDX52781.1 FMN reductase (NADPH)/FMN reductase [NAD(P)H] [Halanaerobium saccharolyticum]
MNETIKLINKRASLRKYADKEISQQDKDTIINSALRAPTAGNMMLYSIIVIEDQEKKKLLSKSCDHQPFIAKAPLVMVFLADYQRWYDYYNLSAVKEFCLREDINYSSPSEADLMLACSDALIAAQNSVIAAESLGIGSCYIGDIMENYEKHQEILSLPEFVFPISMLVMGHYPEKRPGIKSRFDKKYLVFENEYRSLNEEELDNMFAERSQKFNPDNSFNADNYGQLMYARKTGAGFSKEMARSVRTMLKKWQK